MVEKRVDTEAPEAQKMRFMDKERRESMFSRGCCLDRAAMAIARFRCTELTAPQTRRSTEPLSYAVRNDTAAVSAALHFKDAAMRRRKGGCSSSAAREQVRLPAVALCAEAPATTMPIRQPTDFGRRERRGRCGAETTIEHHRKIGSGRGHCDH